MRSGHDMKGVFEDEGAWDLMTDVSCGTFPGVEEDDTFFRKIFKICQPERS